MRKYNGRQKIEMVKISNDNHRQIAFSKRRSGVFKKASELSTLCGAEVAIIVFSPGKKVYSFGHPNVESVVDRFVNKRPTTTSSTTRQFFNANVQKLNTQLTEVLNELEFQEKLGKELKNIRIASQRQCWWWAPIEEFNRPQLEQLKKSLEELKMNVVKKAENIMIQSLTPPQFFQGSSSTGGVLPFDPNHIGLNPNLPYMMHPTPPNMTPHAPPNMMFHSPPSLAHRHEEHNPASIAHPQEEYNPEFGRGFY